MERKTKKMLLVILMIITILATDFFVLSSGIKTYASQLNSETNNSNIEFSAYFKEGSKKVDSIEKSIKAEDMKLYAEIKIKNEGYLKEGAVIELENSNFNLKSEILPSNTHINSIEGNKVNLKQINNGETVEIELGIEPIISDKITTDFLSQVSTVKLIGVYVYSKAEDGQSIKTDKMVCVNFVPDETTKSELETEIITNKVLSINGAEQRVIQQLIKSRITNNEYPEKQTTLNVSIPKLDENAPEINAIAINETTKINNIKTENGTVEITLSNEPDANNQIVWKKNVYNEIVVTYIYPENVDASKIEIETNSKTEVYNLERTYTETDTAIIENEEPNHVIMGRTEITTKELYKGNLYAKIEEQYNTKTSIIITNSEVLDQIVVHEGRDTFGIETREIEANTKYISTEINVEKMLDILGQDGKIEIKNGETITNINKDTPTDANGNAVINYENEVSELEITTSKPEKAGILEIKHKKGIIGDKYTREQLQKVKTINARNTTLAALDGAKIAENTTEPSTLELKETTSKAELTIENNKKILSTTEENEVTLGITLVTNGKQYDLYKNPKMSIKFPEAVTNVEIISAPNKQNADEFTVEIGKFNKTNKTMQINLSGEQNRYPEAELTQSYIQLNLKIVLDRYAISQEDEIRMAYANENAIQYENGTTYGISKQKVQISAPSQLIKMYNVSSNENTSLTETILEQIDKKEAGKTKDFEISLINNKDSDISNLKILGKLPTTENTISGQETNTLETKLKGIKAENAKIYYTENANPSSTDIGNAENGWTQELIENAKMYLIQVDTLERGNNYKATITEQLPSTIEENGVSYSQYGVIYDTLTETETREVSRKVGLASSEAASIKTEITAQVGQDILKSGDIVKEGEVIKYTVTVKNNGPQTLENVQLKLDVPEGTTYVRPIQRIVLGEGTEYEEIIENNGYIYSDKYYEEITEETELSKLTNIAIPKLTLETPYVVTYEVRINKGTEVKEFSNKSTVTYNGFSTEIQSANNIIQDSNIRITMKKCEAEKSIYRQNESKRYIILVENMTELTVKDIEIPINTKGAKIESISTEEGEQNLKEVIKINEIAPNETETINVYIKIDEDAKEFSISAIANDNQNNTCRSNMIYGTVMQSSGTISMISEQNKKYIHESDQVEYIITVKNTGEVDNAYKVLDTIPYELQVEAIYENNELKLEATNEYKLPNQITYAVVLKPQEQTQIRIKTRVKSNLDGYKPKVISNTAKLDGERITSINSQIVTHIFEPNESPAIKNVISGYIWFDQNENGRKDLNENYLSDVIVRLYDLDKNEYVKNEEGKIIHEIIDTDGKYTFFNVKDGDYLVVFEYDIEKYVLTTPNAQGVDSSLNSKATIKSITTEREITRYAGIELKDLKQNAFEMNIGLKENIGQTPEKEQPGIEILPYEPEQPNNPQDPNNPEQPINTKEISGYIWLDINNNGKKDEGEKYLSGIKAMLYSINSKHFVTDESGKIIEKITNENGKYEFSNIEKGLYIVIFEYDQEKYELASQATDITLRKLNINGKETTVAVTDKIEVEDEVLNVNMGLKENLKFDFELNKYISKIVVNTSKGTKTYDYTNKVLGKVEIHKKQIQGALVVLEYTINVKNTGEVPGNIKNIVDYIPSGLTFNSELNKDWYFSQDKLYTKSLENIEIEPGEEKNVKLVLTKTMTSENVGLINNRAEIYQDYNKFGKSDIDSIPNNQKQDEDDFGTTDVIIQVATGGNIAVYTILSVMNIILIYIAIKIMIKNGIIEIKTKEERR